MYALQVIYGLLGIIGLTAEDLAAWKIKQETKKR
jgi:hypothetical protein